MLLAQLLLRPIHVIRSGLTRLGKGEFGVQLDLNQQDEFGELGTFFNAVSAQLSADRSQMAGQVATSSRPSSISRTPSRSSSPRGELLFANPAMRALLPRGGGGRVARATSCRRSSAAAAVGADAGQPPVARPAVGDASASPGGSRASGCC